MRERLSKGNVIVAHPGTQHSYQTALGLQEAGLLRRYVTGFYYKKPGFFSNVLCFLPARYAAGLEREFRRRRNENLDDDLVRTFPAEELFYLLSARSKFFKKWSGSVLHWRNEKFDVRVARMVEAERPEAVICYDTSALKTFQACEKVGSLRILDQSIGHIKTGIEILREEARLHPEFADSLATDVPGWLVERCVKEALTADWILAASEYARDSLVSIGVQPSRVIILPYGTDIARFCPATGKKDNKPFRILFVGQIGQRKGIKYLLEAFKRLRLPDAELVLAGGIAGAGDGLRPYQGIFKHVQNVPHHEVHTRFQDADIFVYPALHEGSAIAVYEALACGLPVITTPNAGSVVRDGEEGFIVPVRDVEALMEKILLLYQNKELRNEMRLQARKRAESFTWQAYRQRLGALVQNFIQGNKP